MRLLSRKGIPVPAAQESETDFMHRLRLHLQRKYVCRIFRNNVGSGWLGKYLMGENCVTVYQPRRVRFGLAKGSADLIGISSVTITPDMVGERVGIFTAIETKKGAAGPTDLQASFLAMVTELGGIAVCAHGVGEADATMTHVDPNNTDSKNGR